MEKQRLIDSYIYRVENAIIYANNGSTKLEEGQLNIQGMSSKKIRIFLNEIVKPVYTRYLEIGVWMGSTFVSALYKNFPECAISIDNFSEFTSDQHVTVDIKAEFMKNLVNNNISNCRFIDSDCFNLTQENKESIKDIDVYLYDGGHTVEDHKKAVTYYYDNLTDIFLFIVDDWNSEEVKLGTKLGLQESNIKVHASWELPADYNGDVDQWWNGYYVAVCEKVKVTNE